MTSTITKTIRLKDDLLETGKVYTAAWEALQLLGVLPSERYQVTYYLDPKGAYRIEKRRIMVLISMRTKKDMGLCFAPKEWDGMRVNRKVVVL